MMATRCSPLFRIPSPSPPPSSNARAAHHVTRALPASAPVDALQLVALDPAAVQLYDVAKAAPERRDGTNSIDCDRRLSTEI
jgi:hypothetical protein